jgi:hypothetical protein
MAKKHYVFEKKNPITKVIFELMQVEVFFWKLSVSNLPEQMPDHQGCDS